MSPRMRRVLRVDSEVEEGQSIARGRYVVRVSRSGMRTTETIQHALLAAIDQHYHEQCFVRVKTGAKDSEEIFPSTVSI
jgi:hypothetical protein